MDKDAVLPMEVVVPPLRFAKQSLTLEEYREAMFMELKSADNNKMQAPNDGAKGQNN